MSGHPVSAGGRADATEVRQKLLGRLGLRADATDQDVEAAHDELVEFLELAPHDVKSWAASATAEADEAFALLSGPEKDLVAAAPVAVMAQVSVHKATPGATAVAATSSGFNAPAAPPAPPAKPWAPAVLTSAKAQKSKLIGAGVAVAVVAVVASVFFMGKGSAVPGITGTPTSTSTTAASNGPTPVPADPAKVAALMQKITANPKDKASFQALGDIYFAAADYKNASVFEQKVLGVDPKNQVALLAGGAAQFNLGNAPAAKKLWLVAAKLYPKSAEVHYDLGFLYMSATPPDSANMTAEWKKVVAIDPNSALAKTVSSHLASSTPKATASPSAK
jgi:tetratricopeptide (TPR) repeat protein